MLDWKAFVQVKDNISQRAIELQRLIGIPQTKKQKLLYQAQLSTIQRILTELNTIKQL